ncbi:rod shape-determining protein RodA [Candidatus Neoehrlichia procyonis]|uniref:Rod shape-determining protein RodA n=1 Tax=Candidatus Neoehrlichia procyonis str. RAC413 TaxID=1359163 RepID=A0A0F3NQU3_9RICK|nr:rod shape-determining protein RodA [Candidatus Neoehrlichia lotoris]KJV69274.1 rod shape-determining protein RodA [Candidatus Neoehrlichia lotoris str. RAC413]
MKIYKVVVQHLPKINYLLIVNVVLLFLIGISIQYSASGGKWAPFASHQLSIFILSLPLVVVVSMIRLEWYIKYAYCIYVLALLLLLMIHMCGISVMGATRWIRFGGLNIQPSEFAKIALILVLARYFHDKNFYQLMELKNIMVCMAIILPLMLLVLKQPNLGTASIMFAMSLLVMSVVVNSQYLVYFFVMCIVVSPIMWNSLHFYQKSRIISFFSPEKDPLGAGYNTLQSQIAIGSGGIYGKGLVNGSQAQLNFLPEKQTDFVFTVFSEEWGFVGVIILFMLYSLLVNTGLYIALCAKNVFHKLVSVGISMFFFLHFVINIGMVTGMLPIVGVPLPFLSYGGSVTLTSMILVGMLLSIHASNKSSYT